MNFLDPYDITTATTRTDTPPPSAQPEKSINEEVTQVLGQLGSFWGGFRKQSQIAINTARKDISEVVSSAQKELGKLTAEAPKDTEASTSQAVTKEPSTGHETTEVTAAGEDQSDTSVLKDDSTPTEDSEVPQSPSSTVSSGLQSIFSRLQSTLPPNVVSTVQNHVPESLKHAATEGVDFAQLRSTLSSEFQRVQGVTRAQAEEYVHKSEAFLKEAVKEAQIVLKDAVKVIPPEEAAAGSSMGTIWDGSDVWMLPTNTQSSKGKSREGSSSSSTAEAQRSVATRAESLLKTLKHNSEIIMHDPEADEVVKEVYHEWLEEESKKRAEGITDSESWIIKGKEALAEPIDGQALQNTHDQLVPSELSDEEFWKRYFFRVHQIEQDEQRRRALLQNSVQHDENFSWEDDEEDITTSNKLQPAEHHPPTTAQAEHVKEPSAQASTPANTSPRASSDESYDVVSSANSANGENKPIPREPKGGDDDDGDSDWE